MLKGIEGDKNQLYQSKLMKDHIANYRNLWKEFKALTESNLQSATLYKPYAFDLNFKEFHGENGMEKTVNYFEKKTQQVFHLCLMLLANDFICSKQRHAQYFVHCC